MKDSRFRGGYAVFDDLAQEAIDAGIEGFKDIFVVSSAAAKDTFDLGKAGAKFVANQGTAFNDINSSYKQARNTAPPAGGGGRRRLTRRKYKRKTRVKRKTRIKRKTRVKRKTGVKRKTRVKRKTKRRYSNKQVKTKKFTKGGTNIVASVMKAAATGLKKTGNMAVKGAEEISEYVSKAEDKGAQATGTGLGTAVTLTSKGILQSLNAIEGVTAFTIDMGEGTGNTVIVFSENLGNSIEKIGSSLAKAGGTSIKNVDKILTNVIANSNEYLRQIGNSSKEILLNVTKFVKKIPDEGFSTVEQLAESTGSKIVKVGEVAGKLPTDAITLLVNVGEKGTAVADKSLLVFTNTGSSFIRLTDKAASLPINETGNVIEEIV